MHTAVVAEIEAMKRSLADLEERLLTAWPSQTVEPPLFVSPAFATVTDETIERMCAQDAL
jgi:hypothetical protein